MYAQAKTGMHKKIQDCIEIMHTLSYMPKKYYQKYYHLVLYEFMEDPSAPFPTEFLGEPSLLLAPIAPAASGSRGHSASPSSSPILRQTPPLHQAIPALLLSCNRKNKNYNIAIAAYWRMPEASLCV